MTLGLDKLNKYIKDKKIISKNLFLEDLLKEGKKLDSAATESLVSNYTNKLEDINKFLYLKLNHKDRKTFIGFVLKRFGGIEVISIYEKIKSDFLFKKAVNLLLKRNDLTDPISINFLGKKVKFITSKSIELKDTKEKDKVLVAAYEIVHPFFLREYYKKGFVPNNKDVIFDCGAARGDTAITFTIQYPDSIVHSFECNSRNYEELIKNIEINNLKKVIPVKTFLYSKTGKETIAGNEEKTVSLDDYVVQNNVENIGLIKFDIEGAEMSALEGAINTIKDFKPLLYIPIYHLNSDIYEIPKFIDKLGFKTKLGLKWVEKGVWGVDCVLFVKFLNE